MDVSNLTCVAEQVSRNICIAIAFSASSFHSRPNQGSCAVCPARRRAAALYYLSLRCSVPRLSHRDTAFINLLLLLLLLLLGLIKPRLPDDDDGDDDNDEAHGAEEGAAEVREEGVRGCLCFERARERKRRRRRAAAAADRDFLIPR